MEAEVVQQTKNLTETDPEQEESQRTLTYTQHQMYPQNPNSSISTIKLQTV